MPTYPPLGHAHVPGLLWAPRSRRVHQPGGQGFEPITWDLNRHNHLGASNSDFYWEGPRELVWSWNFNQLRPGAAGTWEGGHQVLEDWSDVRFAFCLGSGSLYAVRPHGSLWWYPHTGWFDGAVSWGTERKVGDGWADPGLLPVTNTVDVVPYHLG